MPAEGEDRSGVAEAPDPAEAERHEHPGSFDPGPETGYLRKGPRSHELPVEIGSAPFDPGPEVGVDTRRSRRAAKRQEKAERKQREREEKIERERAEAAAAERERIEQARREREELERRDREAAEAAAQAERERELDELDRREREEEEERRRALDAEAERKRRKLEEAEAAEAERREQKERARAERDAQEREQTLARERERRRREEMERSERKRAERKRREQEERERREREKATAGEAKAPAPPAAKPRAGKPSAAEPRAAKPKARAPRAAKAPARAARGRAHKKAPRLATPAAQASLRRPTAKAVVALGAVIAIAFGFGALLGLPLPLVGGNSGQPAKASEPSGASLASLDAGTPAGLTKGPYFPIVLDAPADFGEGPAKFGAARSGHIHEGQDIFAKPGTPLVAVRDGIVVDGAGGDDFYSYGGGNDVVIYSPVDDRSYVYLHMLHPALVKAGDHVKAGQPVGQVGCTGSCDGPHLHFEVRVGRAIYGPQKKALNPLPLLKQWPQRPTN